MDYESAKGILLQLCQKNQGNPSVRDAIVYFLSYYQTTQFAVERYDKRIQKLTKELDECKTQNIFRMTTIGALNYAVDVIESVTKKMSPEGRKAVIDIITAELNDRK